MKRSEIKGVGIDPIGLPSSPEYWQTAGVRSRTRQTATWATRPLCTRYLVVVFGLQPTTLSVGNGSQALSFYWALGTLDDGDTEILGWWQAGDSEPFEWSTISNDLTARGVKHVRIFADSSGALDGAGADGTEFDGGFGSHSLSGAQQRRVAAAGAQMRHVQAALERAVLRHGAFANAEAAAALVDSQLQRLDRAFWSPPDVAARRAPLARMPLKVAA